MFAAARPGSACCAPEARSVMGAGRTRLAAGPVLDDPASFRAKEACAKPGMAQSTLKAARLAWSVSGPRAGR